MTGVGDNLGIFDIISASENKRGREPQILYRWIEVKIIIKGDYVYGDNGRF